MVHEIQDVGVCHRPDYYESMYCVITGPYSHWEKENIWTQER